MSMWVRAFDWSCVCLFVWVADRCQLLVLTEVTVSRLQVFVSTLWDTPSPGVTMVTREVTIWNSDPRGQSHSPLPLAWLTPLMDRTLGTLGEKRIPTLPWSLFDYSDSVVSRVKENIFFQWFQSIRKIPQKVRNWLDFLRLPLLRWAICNTVRTVWLSCIFNWLNSGSN